MNPTPYELASLAALMANGSDPRTKFGEALALWKSAAEHLHPHKPDAPEAERKPFDSILKLLMPTLRPGPRNKRFHDFVLHSSTDKPGFLEKLCGVKDELTFLNFTKAMKRDGVPLWMALEWLHDFPEWHEKEVSRKHASGGKAKAAKAKQARIDAAKRSAWGNDGRPVFTHDLGAAEAEIQRAGKTPARGSK